MKRILQAMTVLLATMPILVPAFAGSVRDLPSRAVTPKATQRQQIRHLADTLEARPIATGLQIPIPTVSAPLDKPDLCVEDLWVTASPNFPGYMTRIKGNIAPGDTIYLVCSHSNQGASIIQQWWKTGYYVDGVLVHADDNRDINTGGRAIDVAKIVAPQTEGVHYYECRMDYENSIPESDERNNRKEIPFRVGASPSISGDLPDLIVSDISLDGTNIEIWIQNVGGGVAQVSSVQGYMDGNAMGPEIAIQSDEYTLGPGDFAHFTQFYWRVGINTEHVIRAVADPANRVHESNEEDNELTVRIVRR
jgi:subtilase family serine protease